MKRLFHKRTVQVSLLIAVLLPLVFGMVASTEGPAGVRREVEGDNVREARAAAEAQGAAPLISLVEALTPYCYQPDPRRNDCYVNWYRMSVDAAPSSMSAMTVTIQAVGPVARYQGFFQQAITVTHDMNGQGFMLPCGSPGAGGNAGLGNGYDWTIAAEDASGNTSTSSGVLYCPPFTP
jgi:hypothetical protein